MGPALTPAYAEEAQLRAGVDREQDLLAVVADAPPPGARPRFPGSTGKLARHWWLAGDGDTGSRLLAQGAVDRAWLALRPAPPPVDIVPVTPVFEQAWLDAFPVGLGFSNLGAFPGADGAEVRLVNVEYAWDAEHEDIGPVTRLRGEPETLYAFHGTAVLGVLLALLNDYGVQGGAPAAEVMVAHPDTLVDGLLEYDVALAIYEALAVLQPGDVILVEQQVYGPDGEFLPVSWDEAVRDVVEAATEQGVVGVVPSANGGVDLDDPTYGGVFDLDVGAIVVGGGFPPSYGEPRAWAGSDYGGGVHLQAWFTDIVTLGGSPYTDLYFPRGDERQAYTSVFGGTSGASALVAAMAAVVQSARIAARGAPLAPRELRALLVTTAVAQVGAEWVGPQPDLRRALRVSAIP